MRAKFKVTGVTPSEYDGKKQNEVVKFIAVGPSGSYPDDGSDENNSYAKWSPSAELSITIANPNLWNQFRVGQEFYADFTLAKNVEPSFKTYRSHKIVDAIRITSQGIDRSGRFAVVVDGILTTLPDEATDRIEAALAADVEQQVGSIRGLQAAGLVEKTSEGISAELGYLVKYQDGYLSYSPKKAFEDGYTETNEVFDSTGKSIGIRGEMGPCDTGLTGVPTAKE